MTSRFLWIFTLTGAPTLLLAVGVGAQDVPDPGAPLGGDSAEAIPPDTYRDSAVEGLLVRAREARSREITGIESYEARTWERFQVGLTGSTFRRDRGLLSEERAARVRWEEGERVIRWEGAVQAVPVAGLRSDESPEMAASLAERLSALTGQISPNLYSPGYVEGDDRIFFGGDRGALHPVADTAGRHYRYRSGDTLRVTFPPDGRQVTLLEALVEPRRADAGLVAGSFWFDANSGQLVRAAYRPARPYFFLAAEDGDPEAARGLPRALQAEIQRVTVDYGLHHLEWWLPHHVSLTVEVRMGQLVQFPFVLEWRMDDYVVNEAPSPELDSERPPEGWTRQEMMRARDVGEESPGDSVRVITLVPPADSLHLAPELTGTRDGRLLDSGPVGLSERELQEFRAEVARIFPPTAVRAPRIGWGLEDGLLRYNRVEGLSVGLAGEAPLGRGLSGRVEARTATSDHTPLGELRVQRGVLPRQESVAVYRRLAHTSDWDDPFGLTASVSTLVTGGDRGDYFRTHGAEVTVLRGEVPGAPQLRLFAEAHRSVERTTNFHLGHLFGSDTLRVNRAAEEGTWYGGSLSLRGHSGANVGALRLFGRARGEVAWSGEGDYRRLLFSGGAARGLGPVGIGLEAGAGAGWGRLPPQREFYLAGSGTVRGVRPGSIVGASHWFARAELSRGPPAAQVVLFMDLGWAGPRESFGSGRPKRAAGLGLSLLDGIFRLDLARSIDSPGSWRAHFYLDGLL